MAQEAPQPMENENIQFKLYGKFSLFNVVENVRSNVNLLAIACSKGILFAADPHKPILKACILKQLVNTKTNQEALKVRTVPLPSLANSISCSADGNMLAINYTQNGNAILQIYAVASFVNANIQTLYQIRLSPEENVQALQLLWNPVLTTTLAVILNNGGVVAYTLKEGGNFEMHSLDKSQGVRCGCWSPKGKQIVFGFAQGKLQQHKPDLSLAKTLNAPAGLYQSAFDAIALHWLSTHQFAVILLPHEQNPAPCLYIVNAPKGVPTPNFINYYDICFSSGDLRAHQFTFTHIMPWSLLLVSSANGVEVGVLGTQETGDTPSWKQYNLLGEARIEMPLTANNDETYPVGFVYDTSSSHQIKIDERQLPSMPMVHVLSTDGTLASYNFLNLTAGAPDVCSPPPPITDNSGQFVDLQTESSKSEPVTSTPVPQTAAADMSFAFPANAVTSTPAVKEKSASMFSNLGGFAATTQPAAAPAGLGVGSNLFGATANNPTTTLAVAPTSAVNTFAAAQPTNISKGFGSLSAGNTGFSGFGSLTSGAAATTFTGFAAAKPTTPATAAASAVTTTTAAVPISVASAPSITSSKNQTKPTETNKPLYTVPPTFSAPQTSTQKTTTSSAASSKLPATATDEAIIKDMIALQISSFDMEIKQQQSKGLLAKLGKPEEIKIYTKKLNDLQEIIDQANDRDFEIDVQNLRQSLNESINMLTECKTKLEMFKNPDMTRLTSLSTNDPISQRQLAKLKSYLSLNQTELQQIQNILDAQWSAYQDLVRRNTKSKMHIPCLEGIYQRLTKLKNLVGTQRMKLNYIKSKLKQKGITYNMNANELDISSTANKTNKDSTMESLADSILSMSLSQAVEEKRSKLSQPKLQAIRNFTRQHQKINIIKPQRPDRIDLKSEVILETMLKSERKVREGAATNLEKMQQEKLTVSSSSKTTAVQTTPTETMPAALNHQTLAKPTATKPFITPVQQQAAFAPPAQAQMAAAPSFNLGANSPFVKTSMANTGKAAEEVSKTFTLPANTSMSFTTPTSFAGFGSKPMAPVANKNDASKETTAAAPLSFAAKIVGGEETNKPIASVSSNATNAFAGLPSNTTVTLKSNIIASTTAAEQKKSEDAAAKPAFSFAGLTATSSSSTLPAFGGFALTTNTAVSTVVATTTKTTTAASTTTAADTKTTSSFSFGGLGASLSATGSTPSSGFGFGSSSNIISNTSNTETNPTTAAAKPNLFAGFQLSKTTETKNNEGTTLLATPTTNTAASKTITTNTSSITTGFSFGNTAPLVSTTAASTPFIETSKTSSTTTTSDASETSKPSTASSSDAADSSLLGSLNICKPNTKENIAPTTSAPTNIFAAFGGSGGTSGFSFAPASGGAGDASKTTFASSGFSFGTSTTGSSAFGSTNTTTTTTAFKATTTTAASSATSTVTSSTTTTKASTDTAASSAASIVSSATTTTASSTTVPASSSFFGSLTAASITTSAAATTPFGSTAPKEGTSLFGGSSTFAPPNATVTAASSAPTGLFGAAAASNTGLFAQAATTATTSASLFGGAANSITATTAASGGGTGLFGSIPKPDQSVFGSPNTGNTAATAAASPPASGLFAAAAASNPSPFSSPPTVTAGGGNIFAAAAASNTAATGGSIFGGGSNSSGFGSGSIFGGASQTANSPTNVFGTSSGGSVFGQQNVFGQSTASPAPATSGGNLFAQAAASNTQQSSPFGGGSLFGAAAASNNAAGGSLFGAGTNAAQPSAFGSASTGATTGFGSFSQPSGGNAFGSPTNANTSGAFGQGGASVAQTGFGSPQQSSAFAKPVFGGAPTFGNPPAFGAQPAFGSAASFSSPKGFGTFSSLNTASSPGATSAFGAATQQKNNLFEALGSTDTGLSFGNLAQTNNNAPKPAFGGSSFMNYR